MSLIKTGIKLGVFFSVIIFFVVLIKTHTLSTYSEAPKCINATTSNTAIYFVGSSRVKRSLNPEIIKKSTRNSTIYNVGISSSTFLSNCVIADYILNSKGKKIIFVELSPLLNELPSEVWHLSKQWDFNVLRTVFKLIQDQPLTDQIVRVLDILNIRLFAQFSITKEIEQLIRYKENKLNTVWIGYDPSEEVAHEGTSSFLCKEDLSINISDLNIIKPYQDIINRLIIASKNNNTRLYFFLPITNKKKEEKQLIISLYNTLPKEIKLELTEKFISTISKENYLMDSNHLNRQGADVYSKYIGSQLNDLTNY